MYIYPNKRKKKSFDNKRDEILRNGLEAALSRTTDGKGKKFDGSPTKGSNDKSEEKFLRSLLDEEKKDYGGVDLTKKLYESIPSIKKRMKFFELDRVKLEIAEELALAKRVEINMDVNHWKKRFLFPFANIAPIPDESSSSKNEVGPLSDSDKNFNKLVSHKYQFPKHVLLSGENSQEWFKEI